MRKFLVFLFLMAVVETSCSLSTTASSSSAGRSRGFSDLPLSNYSVVESGNGLRLRDLPDTLGSKELTIIPLGGQFKVFYCIKARGTQWAFGAWVDQDGQAWMGYVAARFLKGECEK
jgi:hypothetical protein